jgi:dGTPase
LTDQQLRRAIVHELIDWRVSDIVRVVEKVVTERHIDNIESVRRSEIVVRPSSELAGMMAGLEGFLVEHVYRHATVLARRREAELALRQLFESLLHDPGQLPSKFGRLAEQDGVPRAVGDYIAGMTDRYALEERRRLIVSR